MISIRRRLPVVLLLATSACATGARFNNVAPITPLFLTDSAHAAWIPMGEMGFRISSVAPSYAGRWMDSAGNYNIALVDLADSSRAKEFLIARARDHDAKGFVFRKAKYDYVQLDYWRCQFGKGFNGYPPDYYRGSGVSDIRNRIHLMTVDEKGARQLRRLASRLGIPRDAYFIEIVGNEPRLG